MSRYIVIGAGAVGATTAVGLHEAGRDVVLIARGEHLALLRERGLDYVGPNGPRRVTLPVAGGPDEVELTEDDVLVLATKSQDAESAIAQWAWRPVGPSTAAQSLPIVLLQNGLDNARTALRRFDTVLDAVVLIPATYLRAGEVVSPAAPLVGALLLGRAPHGLDSRTEVVATDLRAAGYLVQTVPDIEGWKAGKLLGNLAYNIDALYGPGPLRDAAAHALRAEARAVLTSAGIEIRDPQTESDLDLSQIDWQPIAGHPRGGSSTWQSLARAGSQESDFLNGEIALLARLQGERAPLNAAVQSRIARVAREGTPPGSLDDDDLRTLLPDLEASRPPVLVDVKALHDELQSPQPPVLLDVRWQLGDAAGRQHYEAGHIPSAVYVDLDSELAAAPQPLAGRHPLPELEQLQEAARGWGVSAGQPVVVYDNGAGMSAARAWWLLRWAGLTDVRILDGALRGWTEAGFDLETGANQPSRGDVVLAGGHLPVLTADEAANFDGVLLDARAGERYRGETEPIDPRAGHIPGALSAPTGENVDADGAFLSATQLRERFAALGIAAGSRVGVYCGSGVTASHQIAALAIAGIDAELFPGSWSAWSSDPNRSIETGASTLISE